jgi:transposase
MDAFLSIDRLSATEAGVRVDAIVATPTMIVVELSTCSVMTICPGCGEASDRVHGRYWRWVADLPMDDRIVGLRLRVRRFRCCNAGCPQRIFCERLPGMLEAYARCTSRLTEMHRSIGFALGGEPGSRLADHLDMPTSPDTLLRRVCQAGDEPMPTPRYVGIDDWAIRKGQIYGTIVIDLERGRIVDLLPGRDGEALKKWLEQHSGVEVITRDRWAAFANAASSAAPQALQVADRWHLLKNLREAVERVLAKNAGVVRDALADKKPAEETSTDKADPMVTPASAASQASMEPVASVASAPQPEETNTCSAVPDLESNGSAAAESSAPVAAPSSPASPPASTTRPLSSKEQARQAKRQVRCERFEKVRQLRAEGVSFRRIAKLTGLSLNCVHRYAAAESCPDWNPGRATPTRLDPFVPFIDEWIAQGGRNAADLHRELVARGVTSSYDATRRFLARRLGTTGRPGPRIGPLHVPAAAASAPISPRKVSFLVVKDPERRNDADRVQLERLRDADDTLRQALDLAIEFALLIRKKATRTLAEWLASAEASASPELRSFAAGLRTDEAAVRAAVETPWNNGPVEGHVNRLKTIKRQMYGRAGMPLLRSRVLHVA